MKLMISGGFGWENSDDATSFCMPLKRTGTPATCACSRCVRNSCADASTYVTFFSWLTFFRISAADFNCSLFRATKHQNAILARGTTPHSLAFCSRVVRRVPFAGFFMAVPWRPKPANVHTWTNYVRIVSGCAVWKHAFSHFSGSAWLPSQYSSCVARCVSEEAVVLLIALQLSDNLSLRAHTVDTDLCNMSGVRWLKEMVSTHAPVKNPRKICFQYPMDSNGISKRPGKPRVQRTYRFWVGLKQVWNLYETLNISICPHLPPSLARLISSWMPQWPAAHRARKAAQQTSQDLSSTLNLWYAYTPKKTGFSNFNPEER